MNAPQRPGRPRATAAAQNPADGALEQAILSSRQVVFLFWAAVVLVVLNWIHLQGRYAFETQAGYALIALAALAPLYLWAAGKVPGIPIYPVFCMFQFMAFGFPLLSAHPGITIHDPGDHLAAGMIVALGLSCGTLGWMLVGNRPRLRAAMCRQLDTTHGDRVLLTTIILAILFAVNSIFNLLPLPTGLFSVLRGIIGGVSTLAIFILGQHLGQGKLKPALRWMFILSVAALFATQVATLLLINAITVGILAIGGYTLGARRPPWVALALMVLVISFLHMGKSPVRDAYWGPDRVNSVRTFGDVVVMFEFWIECSLEALREDRTAREEGEKASAFQRASLMHLFLYQKRMLDNGHPHLQGQTYTIIPALMVPRFLNPNKPWTQEGTTLLNLHFGIQTREESMVTTIGWGLLNEGFANFGIPGICGICFLLGLFTGWVTYLSQGFPFLSFRSLVGILILSNAFQTEHALSVSVTSIFQSFVGLLVFNFIFMRNLPTAEWILFIRSLPREPKKKRSLAA